MIAALEHNSGLVRGQAQVPDGTNEIPAVRTLLGEIGVAGRIVTADAMHAQVETARLVIERGGDYLLTIKGNQPELLDDLRAVDWAPAAPGECETVDRGHGRIDVRRCRTVELDGSFAGCAQLPGRRIENRLHHVRDVAYDEDRRRNHVGSLPRNLACLRNAAISIIRLRGVFDHVPEAHRRYAARQQDAIRDVTRADFRRRPANPPHRRRPADRSRHRPSHPDRPWLGALFVQTPASVRKIGSSNLHSRILAEASRANRHLGRL